MKMRNSSYHSILIKIIISIYFCLFLCSVPISFCYSEIKGNKTVSFITSISNSLQNTSLRLFLNTNRFDYRITRGWLSSYSYVNDDTPVSIFVGTNGIIDICTAAPYPGWSDVSNPITSSNSALSVIRRIMNELKIEDMQEQCQLHEAHRVLFTPLFYNNFPKPYSIVYFINDWQYYYHVQGGGPVGFGTSDKLNRCNDPWLE